jgi:type IV fimbrial biogenesis protein FimT
MDYEKIAGLGGPMVEGFGYQTEVRLMFLRAKKREKGFTLLEVLVVIAIAAVMMLIGTPALISQISHTRLKRSARDVATEINAARMNAITKNTKYSVDFVLNANPTQDTFSVSVFSGSWGDDTSRTAREIATGIDITSPGANFSVYFYPNGVSSDTDNATATDSAICINNTSKSNDKMEINISGTTGRVEIDNAC